MILVLDYVQVLPMCLHSTPAVTSTADAHVVAFAADELSGRHSTDLVYARKFSQSKSYYFAFPL